MRGGGDADLGCGTCGKLGGWGGGVGGGVTQFNWLKWAGVIIAASLSLLHHRPGTERSGAAVGAY